MDVEQINVVKTEWKEVKALSFEANELSVTLQQQYASRKMLCY